MFCYNEYSVASNAQLWSPTPSFSLSLSLAFSCSVWRSIWEWIWCCKQHQAAVTHSVLSSSVSVSLYASLWMLLALPRCVFLCLFLCVCVRVCVWSNNEWFVEKYRVSVAASVDVHLCLTLCACSSVSHSLSVILWQSLRVCLSVCRAHTTSKSHECVSLCRCLWVCLWNWHMFQKPRFLSVLIQTHTQNIGPLIPRNTRTPYKKNTAQHTAIHCSTLQHTATYYRAAPSPHP